MKQVPVSSLRAILPAIKRQVHLAKKQMAVTYYGDVVGFLVPLRSVAGFEEKGWIKSSQSISLARFRAHLTEYWESLQFDTDCIYLTYHRRKVVAFVSPRLSTQLQLQS